MNFTNQLREYTYGAHYANYSPSADSRSSVVSNHNSRILGIPRLLGEETHAGS